MSTTAPLRVVDLFSGCGGLSLGFDHMRPRGNCQKFETVLAIDNWKPAIDVFCANHPAPSGAATSVGRLADLSWFNHASEALLFYLVHYSSVSSDSELADGLENLGLASFIGSLSKLDQSFQNQLNELAASAEHKQAIAGIDNKVFSLALSKSALGKLHLSSIRDLRLAEQTLPWVAERAFTAAGSASLTATIESPVEQGATRQIHEAIGAIANAATSRGRGQHKGNAARMASLARYFSTDSGEKLKSIWVTWYSARLAVRQSFCLDSYKGLRDLYTASRRVSVVLGGPPCKGFSRIGRAVIRELRDQGAHAWACDKFGDERNALMYRYVVFLEALQPDLFLFENVSNFASTLKTPDGEFDAPRLLEELIESMECEGLRYTIGARIVRAKEHAIPQARERYIMCGVSSNKYSFNPEDVLELDRFASEVPLGDALSGLPTPKVFRESAEGTHVVAPVAEPTPSGQNAAASAYHAWIRKVDPVSAGQPAAPDAHIYRRPRTDDAKLYKMLAPGIRWMDLKTPKAESLVKLKEVLRGLVEAIPGGPSESLKEGVRDAELLLNDSLALRLLLEQMSSDLPERHHLLADGYLSNGSGQHGDWLERLSATKPCKTVVAHIGKDTYGYVHPFDARPITIREAARVQSFPDWFRFGGVGVVDAYSMIGNAVPPFLSAQLAAKIVSLIEDSKVDHAPRRGGVSYRSQRELAFER